MKTPLNIVSKAPQFQHTYSPHGDGNINRRVRHLETFLFQHTYSPHGDGNIWINKYPGICPMFQHTYSPHGDGNLDTTATGYNLMVSTHLFPSRGWKLEDLPDDWILEKGFNTLIPLTGMETQ